MTVPAIFHATNSVYSAAAGFLAVCVPDPAAARRRRGAEILLQQRPADADDRILYPAGQHEEIHVSATVWSEAVRTDRSEYAAAP